MRCDSLETKARMSAAQHARSVWTPETIAKLRELAAKGLTSREIAESLGMTYNAVIGKCSRMSIRLRAGYSQRAGKWK